MAGAFDPLVHSVSADFLSVLVPSVERKIENYG